MKRAATPSPPASQKRSKNQSNNPEFDPIDEGNGWEQTGPNEWTNKFTNECIDFKPTYQNTKFEIQKRSLAPYLAIGQMAGPERPCAEVG